MRVTTVTVERLKSLDNYENERIAVDIEVEEGEDPELAVAAGRDFIYKHLYGKTPGEAIQALGVEP